MNKSHSIETEYKLLSLNYGYTFSAVLDAALELRIFDQFGDLPGTVDRVAGASGWSRDAVRRLLDVLTYMGLLLKVTECEYCVPHPVAELLSAGSRESIAAHLRAVYAARPRWGDHLVETVCTGNRRSRINDVEDRPSNVDFFVRGGFGVLEDARKVAALSSDVCAETVVVLYSGGGEWALAQAESGSGRTVYALDTPEFIDRVVLRVGALPALNHLRFVPCGDGVQSCDIGAQLVLVPPVTRFFSIEIVRQMLSGAIASLAGDGELLLVDIMADLQTKEQSLISVFDLSLLVNTSGGAIRSSGFYGKMLESMGVEVTKVEGIGLLTVLRARRGR